ncbi:5-formyl-3-hydroxy-2-methylpyridine 4-carboxylate 5-dehydrogenase [Sedimentitalea todarodis]|uniref:3-hydroxyacyl-CoA dehydrogenase NAD-binding domain-containing protein n=1 Tax=Sedimentitalea todarodis TaxID=1631240 RepID=A0ABU3VKJ6_9RHOB|nr:5-formyl-3-hydroxy-2-methylpyridine 4-carboxylate 5-dehydrogenase [Sedimentitalea todarodis]MDU9006707.1 3-hydroxyacyl-CoA dehydrogenase NAD-binding domain-containing protein [Sedimentitalea todarodis]
MKIAIIGMGSMGPGMAARLARGGHSVAGYDISATAQERAMGLMPMIGAALDALEIADQGTQVKMANSLAEAVQGAGLVIENLPENIETKAELYMDLEPLIGRDTIIASDTSGIPVSKLQAYLTNPARFVGMHWSNPPHIVPMIEVIGGEQTATGTVAAIRDLIRDLGLLPVVLKRDVPGFVENRVLYALLRECVDLVESGVIEAEDMDTCVNWGIGFKLAAIGPMRLLDMAGLDIYNSVASFLNQELCDRQDVSPMVADKTAQGHLGMKSGQGLFPYTEDELRELPAARGRKLVALRRVLEGEE